MSEILQNREIFWDGLRLTTRSNSIALDIGCEAHDDTTLDDSSRSNKPGLLTTAAQCEGFYDSLPYDVSLFTGIGLPNKWVSLGHKNTIGSRGYSFKATMGDYKPLKGNIGDIIGFSAGFKCDGLQVIPTRVLYHNENLDDSIETVPLLLGAASDSVIIIPHVWKVEGTTPTLEFDVETDNAILFGSPTTRLTSSTYSSRGAELLQIESAVADDHYRLSTSVSGTGANFGLTVFAAVF